MSRKRGAKAASQQTPEPAPDALPRLAPALLGLGTFLLYVPSLSNGLTNWDDPDYVLNNPIAEQGWRGVLTAFTTPFDGAWYPLTHATYSIVHALGGQATALHAVQVACFALAVALVPLALAAFRVPWQAGVAAAVLWAAHPMRVESVSWAANLKDALAVLFAVAAFAAFARGRRVATVACFAAALLSKSAFFPLAALFPVAAALGGASPGQALRRTWELLLAGAAVAVVAGVLHQQSPAVAAAAPLASRLAAAAWNPWWYLGRIALPLGPRAVYAPVEVTFASARFAAALGLWAALAVAAWRAPTPLRRGLGVTVAAFLLALLPVGGLVPLRYDVAERYTLVPSLALFAALATAAVAWRSARVAFVGAAVLALVYAPLNVLRQREWHDAISLWEANVRVAPGVWTVHINLADAYGEAGRFGDARRETEAALAARPERVDALGQILQFAAQEDGLPAPVVDKLPGLLQAGRFQARAVLDAAEWCLSNDGLHCASAALDHVAADDARALRLRSVVARKLGRAAEALTLAQRSLDSGEARARVEVAYALAELGRFDEALALSAPPLAGDEHGTALLKGAHAYTLLKMGRTEEGRAEAEAALNALGTPAPNAP
jgi:tetratricopeptide (TPR) repeat protein